MSSSPSPTPPPEPPASTHWAQVRALFDEAMELPAADRAGFVEGVTADDWVRHEVLSLLAHGGDDSLLERPAAAWAWSDGVPELPHASPPAGDRQGQRIGPWAMESLLGRGGMGEVWLARRVDGAFQGQAAIKVLRRGMDSAGVLARFALEQQALARLTHPHIARLLDAGRTADGLPYVVMEHVPGVPISQACQGRRLEDRLALFLQLADAVAHAHRNLLVHRDLKPSNVLVMPPESGTDGAGRVKLLDFGIAKALDPLEGADPSITQAGERPFTPHFASPEQVRGEPVSTATDIYSLGVLLYVMLTGTRPYGRDATSPHEAARSVLEEEPSRPSTLSPGLVADPQWLATRKRLRGDLDNVLLKALDKRVERRYSSVDALAADIRAFLGGHPVSARPASAAYLASRFVRRHRMGVGLAALALAGVVGGAALALWQARIADEQRDLARQRFQQVHEMANQLVFKYHDQIENLPGATKVREALLSDALVFLDGLAASAQEDAKLAQDLAGAYYRISRLQGLDTSINTDQHDQAAVNLRKALALSERYAQRADLPLAAMGGVISMHISHGELLQRAGRMAAAEQALLAGLPLVERGLARAPLDTWSLSSALTLYGVHARLLGSNLAVATLGRWRDACARADLARATADKTLAADPANVYGPDTLAFTVGEQAQCRLLSGDAAGAAALFEEQVALRDRMAQRFADDMDFRYQRSIARANLARAQSQQGAHDVARQTFAQALHIAQQARDADPGNRAAVQRVEQLEIQALALDIDAGRADAARTRANSLWPRVQAMPAGPFVQRRARAEAWLWLARAIRPSDPQRAGDWAALAAADLQPEGTQDDNVTRRWLLAQALGEQAQAHQAQGRRADAVRLATQAMALWKQRPPEEGPPPALRRWITPVERLAAP
jgi:tetratricopeptide (TPR) repeat protein